MRVELHFGLGLGEQKKWPELQKALKSEFREFAAKLLASIFACIEVRIQAAEFSV